jgi:hypothetical protein
MPKVPTVICYDDKNKESFTWGEMKHKDGVVAGVKLLLDPDQPRPIYLPESTAKTDLRKLGKPAVDAVADFIGAIYKHAMTEIETQIPVDYLTMCQKIFVLSVPAVWSDKAKDTTLKVSIFYLAVHASSCTFCYCHTNYETNEKLKAAKLAGLHPVTLIKEPEAAAMYTLHVMQEKALAVS